MRRLIKILLFLAVVVSVWGGVLAVLAARDLAAARSDLKSAKTATRAFEFREAKRSLARADDRLAKANDRLGSIPLQILRRIPAVGRNIKAVGVIADAAQDAVTGARFALSAADALPGKEEFRLEDGRFPLVDWDAVGNASEDAAKGFETAKRKVDAIGDADLLGPIAGARDEFLAEVTEAHSAARNLQLGARVLPDLLGVSGRQNHLVVVQNAAERRATGGAIESFMLLRADDSRVRLVRADPDEAVTGSATDVDAAHRLNLEPDFTQVGLRIAEAYAETTGIHADTVITVDQVAIGNLLQVTGSLTVDGRTLSGDNAVRFLSRDILLDYPVEPGQSIFLGAVTQALSGRLLSGSFAVPDLAEQTGLAAASKHILVWARDPDVQKVLETMNVSGSAFFERAEPSEPLTTAVVGNNPSPAEMDYYARRALRYEIFLHQDGTADVSVRATLKNRAKDGELPGIVIAKSGGDLRQVMQLYLDDDVPARKTARVEAGEQATIVFPVETVQIAPGSFTLRVLRQPGLFEDRLTVIVKLPPGASARSRSGFTEELRFEGALDGDREFTVTW